jgi:DNA invertase Pin-like site-specific DNA recombinase
MKGKFISYLRVSTDRQGEHGYGIDAQRKAVADFLNGGSWQLLTEFVEVESGRRNDRPQLAAALAACRKHKAKLVIAKLDRLARNVAFIANLMDGKIDFICCDMPEGTRLTIHVLAAVAEHEREMIAKRTKDGLRAAQERGVVLGGPALASINSARQDAAVSRARAIAPVLAELAGLSAHAAAAELNARRAPTPTGQPWSAKTVIRARARV